MRRCPFFGIHNFKKQCVMEQTAAEFQWKFQWKFCLMSSILISFFLGPEIRRTTQDRIVVLFCLLARSDNSGQVRILYL
jgi:lipopolysaccharide export LptBFGC system permease protein LptF